MTIMERLPTIKLNLNLPQEHITDLYSEMNLCLNLFIFLMNSESWDNEFCKFIPHCVKKMVLSIYPKSSFFKLQRGPSVLEFDE